MQIRFLIITFVIASYSLNAQMTTPSSCTTSDSSTITYFTDAQRLTLTKIKRQNLTYKDSVEIPINHIDTVFRALIAVYNATVLPARDTVISMLQIHTFPDPAMNRFVVAADSTLSWMQQLKAGNIPTGNAEIDDLISTYNLTNYTYSNSSNLYAWHELVFLTNDNYNLFALTDLFGALPQVQFAELDYYVGDGGTIRDSIYSDHVELTYNYAWGDCMAGCMYQRYWKFKVYFDCSVEYVESFGNTLTFNKLDVVKNDIMTVYPNPFSDKISVQGINGSFDYSISNVLGQQIKVGKSSNGIIENLGVLDENIYFLNIKNDNQSRVFKVYTEK
jgi:hypothetical protein